MTRSKFDAAPYLGSAPVRVVANLPYNIATALLVGWLTAEPWPPWYDRLVLMFQREVAERIVAGPGSKTYGRLSVLAGWRAQAKILFDIAPSAFVPPPKVTSSLVRACAARRAPALRSRRAGARDRRGLRPAPQDAAREPEVARLDPVPLLENTAIDPTARAEDISVEGFVALANACPAKV